MISVPNFEIMLLSLLPDMLVEDFLACFVAAVLAIYVYYRNNGRLTLNLPLPPGPKRLPFIGNLLDMPRRQDWLEYTRWGKEYDSDILYVSVAGRDIIIINSVEIANDLLDKRSAIYSSRPSLPMINDFMGYNWLLFIQPYGKRWRECRSLFQRHFPSSNTSVHRSTVIEHVHKLLLSMLYSPDDYLSHIEHMIGGLVISLAYGLDVLPTNDPYIRLLRQAIEHLFSASYFLVNFIPSLKYIPQSFPGAGFKKKAAEWRAHGKLLTDVPFSAAENAMVEATGRSSFTSFCLNKIDSSKDSTYQRGLVKDTAATFFVAGFDSTVSTLHMFILAMLCHPEAQKKAQIELDTVMGYGRIPDFNDEGRLPYLSAVVKELLRWRPVAPLGMAHCNVVDDVCNGYYLPKESLIMTNIWAMMHNERDYPDPDKFIPERFLKEGKIDTSIRDPTTVVFGFGRRICPGRAIALSSIWYAVAAILSMFDISDFVEEDEEVVKPSMDYLPGLASHPVPFKCTIKPRSKATEDLVKSLNE